MQSTFRTISTLSAAELLGSNFDLRHANSGSKDPLPEVLTDTQDRTLVAFLRSSVPQGEPLVSLSHRLSTLAVPNQPLVMLDLSLSDVPLVDNRYARPDRSL